MASNQAAGSAAAAAAASSTREYVVRVPKGSDRKFSVMKFNPAQNVDFTKCGHAKLARENNLRDFKISHDIDMQPKFGAGSEFGREQKDEARRKKFGIQSKKYNPDAQPWMLKLGTGKEAKRLKGERQGGLLDNTSYYVFTQCADGAFEAFPLKEWYNFKPVQKYKHLNEEEVEKEFEKRDRTINFFNLMMKKRMRNEDLEDGELEEAAKKEKAKGRGKDFKLTDMDEFDEGANDEDSDDEDGSDAEEKKAKKKKEKENQKGSKKKKKKKDKDEFDQNAEASEDSDSVDEGEEVDYMDDTDSNDDDMHDNKNRDKNDKYDDKGVADEDGLRKVLESGDEDEDEENKDEEEKEDEDTDRPKRAKEGGGSGSESSDSGESDSDPEKEGTLNSALFMVKKKEKSNSRPGTPVAGEKESKKRKQGDRDSPLPKKAKKEGSRTSTPTPQQSAPSTSTAAITSSVISGEGAQLEEAVRRYLQRKPMTIKDLLQKLHKSTGINDKDMLVKSITQILKKINPEKKKVQDKLYLHIPVAKGDK